MPTLPPEKNTLPALVCQGPAANREYGVAVTGWRGLSMVGVVHVGSAHTSIWSQRASPLNALGPNAPASFSCTTNRPFATGTFARGWLVPI